MKSIEETLAKNIRDRRKSLKWSQKKLAKEAKISLHTVFRIEKCEQAPRRANVEAIADALGVARETLYLDSSQAGEPTGPTLDDAISILSLLRTATPLQIDFVRSYLSGSAVADARERLSSLQKKSHKP